MQDDLRVGIPLQDQIDPAPEVFAVCGAEPDVVPFALPLAAEIRCQGIISPLPVPICISVHHLLAACVAVQEYDPVVGGIRLRGFLCKQSAAQPVPVLREDRYLFRSVVSGPAHADHIHGDRVILKACLLYLLGIALLHDPVKSVQALHEGRYQDSADQHVDPRPVSYGQDQNCKYEVPACVFLFHFFIIQKRGHPKDDLFVNIHLSQFSSSRISPFCTLALIVDPVSTCCHRS